MTEDDSKGAFCIECGNEIGADTKFCTECGAEQVAGAVGNESAEPTYEEDTTESTADSEGKGSALHRLPGFKSGNSTRRNVLVGAGYSLAGLMAIGAAAGPQEEDSNTGGSGGNGGGSGDGSGGSGDGNGGGSNNEDPYPNAFYYDESTGIVLEDDIEAEADQIGSLYIRGSARNESGNDYDYVQVTFSVLDGSGAKIADALANTSGLTAGQTWRYEALAASADDAESYELQGIDAY